MRQSLLLLAVAALLAIGLTISGCGIKGDLYLPPPDSEEPADEEENDHAADS